ncbi:hypothetical protein R3P38DRAFT_603478 [Favolaschia claudopus]|uniref:F-box domain-containing protein n=1 Tax=Favolaschia claudopus TaxID=2862362 RepID=A0AAW0C842_9AGAR
MHRALHISEIVDLILAELSRLSSNPFGAFIVNRPGPSNGSLAALARTCKSFQNPALSWLWREQFTLRNLLKCLPSHLWEQVKINEWPHSLFRITKTTQPSDWEIPLAYALRVQTLHLSAIEVASCADSVYEILSSELPRDFLCPKLTSVSLLYTFSPHPSHITHARLFLGPKVVDVRLALPMGSDEMMLELPIQYPALKGLDISLGLNCDTASKIALSLTQITHLRLDFINREALEHISQLITLQSLTLVCPDLEDMGGPLLSLSKPTSGASRFPALKNFRLDEIKVECATELVSVIIGSPLHTVYISTEDDLPNKSTTHQLYTTLADHISHTSLRDLSIGKETSLHVDAAFDVPFAEYIIDGNSLTLLFPFKNLNNVLLDAPLGFVISDSTI